MLEQLTVPLDFSQGPVDALNTLVDQLVPVRRRPVAFGPSKPRPNTTHTASSHNSFTACSWR